LWQQLEKHAKIYCSDEDIESQSFQGEGVRGASTACRATGTNEIDHMPGGIDHMPGRIDHMPGGIDHMPGGIDHMPGRIDHMPSGSDYVPSGIGSRPSGIELCLLVEILGDFGAL